MGDVLADAGREKDRLLGDKANLPSEPAHIEVLDIKPVEQDAAA